MHQNNFKISEFNVLGVLLGIAAATGHATALRFFELIGLSEILFLVLTLYLLYKSPLFFMKKGNFFEIIIRSYFLFTIFLIFPLVTIFVYSFLPEVLSSSPIYILSFILAVVLMFVITESIKIGLINLRLATLVFLMIFTIINIYVFLFETTKMEEFRYSGFSMNPNQLNIYIVCLMLMLVIFRRIFFFFSLPFLVFIGIKTQSDTFSVILVGIIFTFIFLSIFNSIKIYLSLRLSIMFIFFITLISLAYYFYYQELIIYLKAADNEDLFRINLLYNALLVILQSPFVGWGAGSFSGIFFPFEGGEAHNNFLDLSMQFGVIIPIILHYIIFAALFKSIKQKDHLLASIIIAFIISGLFNFLARHFVFWLVIGILSEYLHRNSKLAA
jgi:hypothetical protein